MKKSNEWTKKDYMEYWVFIGYHNRNKWDNDPKKPLRTESWCDYLYDNHWDKIQESGLTRNDVFYGMRFPINRFKKTLK